MANLKQTFVGTFNWYRLRLEIGRIAWWHRWLRPSVTGDCPVAVCLTTHGKRLQVVHIAIQSIVAGSTRPQRLILWLDSPPEKTALTPQLLDLQRRGLEICYSENFGPHTKYYPYVRGFAGDGLPLVIADDDVIYPGRWLQGLWSAHREAPQQIHCYLARRIQLQGESLGPYSSWTYTDQPQASPLNLALGFGGVIYPSCFQLLLREHGEAFRQPCPRQDDLWLHVMAIRHGYVIHQVAGRQRYPWPVPGSQVEALCQENQYGGGNDAQIASTYRPTDLAILFESKQQASGAL